MTKTCFFFLATLSLSHAGPDTSSLSVEFHNKNHHHINAGSLFQESGTAEKKPAGLWNGAADFCKTLQKQTHKGDWVAHKFPKEQQDFIKKSFHYVGQKIKETSGTTVVFEMRCASANPENTAAKIIIEDVPAK